MKRSNLSILTLHFFLCVHLACTKEYSYEGDGMAGQPALQKTKPPVAVAGPDTSVVFPNNHIRLDGSASYDPDGTITGWEWTLIEGPSNPKFSRSDEAIAEAGDLLKGIYRFDLKVTDNDGLFSRDTVQVKVDSTGAIMVFDHLQWKEIPDCAFVIEDIYSYIPADRNFELYLKWVDVWGSVRDWEPVPKKGSQTIYDLFFYEIKNGDLVIHSTKIVCNYDESRNYSAGIKIY